MTKKSWRICEEKREEGNLAVEESEPYYQVAKLVLTKDTKHEMQ